MALHCERGSLVLVQVWCHATNKTQVDTLVAPISAARVESRGCREFPTGGIVKIDTV